MVLKMPESTTMFFRLRCRMGGIGELANLGKLVQSTWRWLVLVSQLSASSSASGIKIVQTCFKRAQGWVSLGARSQVVV